jgi:hypothetical protein
VLELDVGAAAADDVVCEPVVAVDWVVVESFVAVDVVAAGVAAIAVELFACPDAVAARPPIRTVAPTATVPVATVSFLIRWRLRSRLAADG